VDVEEFPCPRSTRDSQLPQHCEVEYCCAKEKLLWPTIVVSFNEQPPGVCSEFSDKHLHLMSNLEGLNQSKFMLLVKKV
jgi:hypothetical protein